MSSANTKSLLNSLSPIDLKQLSKQQKIDLIREHRSSKARNANVIYFLATDLLTGGTGGLSSTDLYEVYEQVLVASLECGRLANARMYLNLLERRFGRKSMRVQQLKGLCLEAEGETEEAKKLYAAVQKECPTNEFPAKRLCAIFKSEGRYREAIKVLEEDPVFEDEEGKKHSYFEVHRGDSLLAYHELSNLHYLCGNLEKAAFYAEEYVLFDHDSFFAHTRLAELHYARKDFDRACAAYSQSLLLNTEPNNARAAYGLLQVVNQVLKEDDAGVKKLNAEGRKRMEDLREMATDTLRNMYAGSRMLSALDAFLQRQADTEKLS